MADHLIAVITVAAKPFQFHHRSISPHHHHTNAGNKLKFHLQFHQFTCKLITINHVLIFSFSFAGLEYHNQARVSLLLPASFSAMEPKRQRRRRTHLTCPGHIAAASCSCRHQNRISPVMPRLCRAASSSADVDEPNRRRSLPKLSSPCYEKQKKN